MELPPNRKAEAKNKILKSKTVADILQVITCHFRLLALIGNGCTINAQSDVNGFARLGQRVLLKVMPRFFRILKLVILQKWVSVAWQFEKFKRVIRCSEFLQKKSVDFSKTKNRDHKKEIDASQTHIPLSAAYERGGD